MSPIWQIPLHSKHPLCLPKAAPDVDLQPDLGLEDEPLTPHLPEAGELGRLGKYSTSIHHDHRFSTFLRAGFSTYGPGWPGL